MVLKDEPSSLVHGVPELTVQHQLALDLKDDSEKNDLCTAN